MRFLSVVLWSPPLDARWTNVAVGRRGRAGVQRARHETDDGGPMARRSWQRRRPHEVLGLEGFARVQMEVDMEAAGEGI
jgi:hypothetical protein